MFKYLYILIDDSSTVSYVILPIYIVYVLSHLFGNFLVKLNVKWEMTLEKRLYVTHAHEVV